MALVPVLAAFALFFLGDWNDWKWQLPPLRCCFPAGALVLAVSTAALCLGSRPALGLGLRCVCYAAAAGFLALLIHTLFFALPAQDAYVHQDAGRPVCTAGVYALCRHPGVLWLAGVYLCLWPAAGLPWEVVAAVNFLNVLLVWFEDRWVFPARMRGYEDYRRSTPFLVPNRRSLRAARG